MKDKKIPDTELVQMPYEKVDVNDLYDELDLFPILSLLLDKLGLELEAKGIRVRRISDGKLGRYFHRKEWRLVEKNK